MRHLSKGTGLSEQDMLMMRNLEDKLFAGADLEKLNAEDIMPTKILWPDQHKIRNLKKNPAFAKPS